MSSLSPFMEIIMRFTILLLIATLSAQSPKTIWEKMIPEPNQDTILYAYDYGDKVGYPELGAHVWAESLGEMDSERPEYSKADSAKGDTLHVSVGAAQVDVYWATKRDHGANFTIEQWRAVRARLKTDLDFNLDHALKQVVWCQGEFKYRWSWSACYNAGKKYLNGERYANKVQKYHKYLMEVRDAKK